MQDELQEKDKEIDRLTGDCNSYKTELTQLQAASKGEIRENTILTFIFFYSRRH